MSAPLPFSLRQLQYAVAVADLRSFRRAAERCRVAQPSLSTQIALLEDVLGARLFERDRRGVLVTPAGERLLEGARRVLRDAEDLQATARAAADPMASRLRIGVIPTVSPYLLPAVAPALRRAFPRLTVAWREGKTGELVPALHEGALDAALLALEADLGDVEHAVVARDPFYLAAPRAHALGADAGPVSPGDLAGSEVLLLDDGHCLRDQALAYCSRARLRELEFRATSLPTLVQMVVAGAGVTLLPRLALPVEARDPGLVIRPFGPPAPARTVALVWRRASPLAAAFRAVAGAMAAAVPGALHEPARTGRTRGGTRASRPG